MTAGRAAGRHPAAFTKSKNRNRIRQLSKVVYRLLFARRKKAIRKGLAKGLMTLASDVEDSIRPRTAPAHSALSRDETRNRLGRPEVPLDEPTVRPCGRV